MEDLTDSTFLFQTRAVQMRIWNDSTIAAETYGLLTIELIDSTFHFQTCGLQVHFLKDSTDLFETWVNSVRFNW